MLGFCSKQDHYSWSRGVMNICTTKKLTYINPSFTLKAQAYFSRTLADKLFSEEAAAYIDSLIAQIV